MEARPAATKEITAAMTISKMEDRTSLRAAMKHCVATRRPPKGTATRRSIKLALNAAIPIIADAIEPKPMRCQLLYYDEGFSVQ